jgi:signal transduction histidine kinase/DNA-binding LacI/PurR family transcriptional regulator/AraC-like DNA-binding protein/CheY-like chemotaxis protein
MPLPTLPSCFSRPLTIGVLTAWLNGPTEINLWHGVADRALERNVNLICFSGGIPHWHEQYEAQKNILFNIPNTENVDGLLIWANILSHTLDRSGLEAFCLRYAPLPIISMGMILPSIPSIQIDMRDGMRKLLSHLIEVHGRRRIAFIRGLEVSQDAEERYQAYIEILKQYHISVDPSLVISGDFRRFSGTAAIKQLIATHPIGFDALVSANDNMAIGAMQALQAQGIRIPEDVVVAGFDDIEETRAITPSLTTVGAPWHLLGSKSVDLLVSKLANEPLPDQILLETELVCRQSCGCQHTTMDHQAGSNHGAGFPLEIQEPAEISPDSAQISLLQGINRILDVLAPTYELDPCWSGKLIEGFLTDVRTRNGTRSVFIQTLTEILSQIPSGTEIVEWQEVLNVIRVKVNRLFRSKDETLKAHDILENGYTVVGEIAHRAQLYQRLEAVDQTSRLNRIVQTMSTTYDIETLMRLLALELPGLGIQSCFLSLYDEKGDNPARSRLVLAVVGKERLSLDENGIRFPTSELVPPNMLPKERRFAFDVEALYFQEEQIGFVMFEIGPRNGDVYTTLRGHLSSALKSAELVQIALEAEAKAIKSDQLKTRLLANVSHELRTPLNIILGLSQTALSSPNPYEIELPFQLAKDLSYIFDSGEHLIRLINDLLDTSRAEIGELDLCCEPVDPRPLIQEVLETFKETSVGKQKKIVSLLEAPAHLPVLHADPVRLRQIFMNLLSNAFKFTQQGSITLGAEVQLPHIHFWVSDTGLGISAELQERIFEPFVKAEALEYRREGIGLGLSITRRLVALHGGSITLDSVPDRGSTFHIYIPLPGLNHAAAEKVSSQGARPVLLWLSRNTTPIPVVQTICQKNALEPYWLGTLDDFDLIVRLGKPVALAWDLANARPGDWSIVQKIRSFSQYCQLPLLLFHENMVGNLSGERNLTNVLLKPAGKQMVQHVLNLLPQATPRGEIWIIDDDPQALEYYQELIGDSLAEYHVRKIHGGREAVRLLDQAPPDLVLLDLMMPDVDGFQVLEQLRSNVRTASIPVIIITGKILSFEDVKRLDVPKVILQPKGVFSDVETATEIQRVLTISGTLPQPTGLLVKQALAYIQQNYSRSFSLVELSETIGVSKSYLSRIFKMDMGISPWDYLNRFRIQKAKETLLLTDESISVIATEVGYEDISYFSRVFHETVGCSPRAYRQQAHTSAAG